MQIRQRKISSGRKNVWTNDFIVKMEYAFAAADIVVSRSGAMAVAELSVVKKPVIFVPFPFAAEDHQTVNARQLTDKKRGSDDRGCRSTGKPGESGC